MPLYKTISVDSQTIVKIWKITESFDELNQNLNLKPDNLTRINNMKSEIHRRGFLSVRHLLKSNGYTDEDLYYDENGKPHLKDGKFVSISHSFIFAGLIISDKSVGIDIEKQRPKIKNISPKFIDYEFQYLNESDPEFIRKLTIIWCIKESLYKQFAQPGLSFKQHTLVIPFTFQDGETSCWIDFEDIKYPFRASYLEFEGFSCAFVQE